MFDILTFDVVTRDFARDMKFVGVWHNGAFRSLSRREDFWALIKSLDSRTYAYSYSANLDLSVLCADNPVFDLANYISTDAGFVWGRFGAVNFADAAQLLHTLDGHPDETFRSAKEEAITVLRRELGLAGATPPEHAQEAITDEELAYSRIVCETLATGLQALFAFIDRYCSPRGLTLAGNALKIWQTSFCPPAISEDHPRGRAIIVSDLDDYFAHSYHGGRTEVFRRGRREDVRLYDVRSMYPAVMRSRYPVPRDLMYRSTRHLSQTDLLEIVQTCEGMAECDVDIAPEFYAPLPLQHGAKVIFPTGQFRGCWNFPELRALAPYHRITVRQAWFSRTHCYPFREFAEHFWGLRTSASRWEATQMKLIMVSLYGKLGAAGLERTVYQRTRTPLDTRCTCGAKRSQHPTESCGSFRAAAQWEWEPWEVDDARSGYWFLPSNSPHDYSSILCFASYTTSLARVEHLRGLKRSYALYGDTDSAFAHDPPAGLLGEDLGQWSLKASCTAARFWTPKTYELELAGGTVHKCKGVPRKYLPELFRQLHAGRDNQLRVQRNRSPLEAAQAHLPAGDAFHVLHSIHTDDDKRQWNGLDSSPHEFAMVEGVNQHVCCR